MAFSVIAETVDLVEFSSIRKTEILTEMKDNEILNQVLKDIGAGYGMDGTKYNCHEVLAELVKIPADTSEAYSVLISVLNEKVGNLETQTQNVTRFWDEMTRINTININN